MDFKQLQSFVTVVQEESFTQAAGRLFVSQSTVSTHIHQLESELNTKLILRTTKSLQITPKGRELYEYALNIMELKERMIQACSIESRRIIHLGASTIPSAYILPQLLADFGKLHQDIYFIIHQSDSQGIINGLKDGLFNLGFIGMSCEDSDFCCQPFCKDRMVVITPVNEHFLRYKQHKENILQDLLREPLILRKGQRQQKNGRQLSGAQRYFRGRAADYCPRQRSGNHQKPCRRRYGNFHYLGKGCAQLSAGKTFAGLRAAAGFFRTQPLSHLPQKLSAAKLRQGVSRLHQPKQIISITKRVRTGQTPAYSLIFCIFT